MIVYSWLEPFYRYPVRYKAIFYYSAFADYTGIDGVHNAWLVPGTFDHNGDALPCFEQKWLESIEVTRRVK